MSRGRRRFDSHSGRVIAAVAIAAAVCAAPATPAGAAALHSTSIRVALIPANGPRPVPSKTPLDGIMPISSSVSGRPSESFDKFSFTNVALSQITAAELAHFDTVALIQVHTHDLTSSAKAALAQFVATGGKLLIHDADKTSRNDYSWLLSGQNTTQIGAGCNGCGRTSGSTTILSRSSIISSNPSDPSYVNVTELGTYTDAIGDSNLLVSTASRWTALAKGTNANSETGAQVASARSGKGLIVYNGYDTDFIRTKPTDPWRCVNSPTFFCSPGQHPPTDWLAHMWYSELNSAWGTTSPTGPPLNTVGTPLAPGKAGLPSSHLCAKGSIFLRLRKLLRLKHSHVIEVDVYVGHKHVLLQLGRHNIKNVTLTGLPLHGKFKITVIATTQRGYHLIAKRRYHAC